MKASSDDSVGCKSLDIIHLYKSKLIYMSTDDKKSYKTKVSSPQMIVQSVRV